MIRNHQVGITKAKLRNLKAIHNLYPLLCAFVLVGITKAKLRNLKAIHNVYCRVVFCRSVGITKAKLRNLKAIHNTGGFIASFWALESQKQN